jgi:hypothetical protein
VALITTLIRLWRRPRRALAVMALCLLVPAEAHAQSERLEAPFGDTVSERVPFYHRAAPTIATAGPLGRLGIIEAKAVGFKSILNLGRSTTTAGLDDASMASYVLLRYFSVPVSSRCRARWLAARPAASGLRARAISLKKLTRLHRPKRPLCQNH